MLSALAVVAVIAAMLSQSPSADRARIIEADDAQCEDQASDRGRVDGCSSATRNDRPGSRGVSADEADSDPDPTVLARPGNTEDRPLTDRTEFQAAPLARTAQLRPTYMTLAQRCKAGLMDAEFRCQSTASPGTFRRARWDDEESSTLQISGRVMTEDGFGIAGVTLVASRISDPDGETRTTSDGYRRYHTESDSNGNYRFEDLPEGDYSIQSSRHENYPSARISARAGVGFANLILRKAVNYLVEGKVTTPLGEPLYKVSVLPMLLGQASVKTDRGGFYRLPVSLPSDAERLSLRFQAPGLVETNQSISVPEKVLTDFRNSETIKLDAVMHPVELTTNVIGTVATTAGKALSGLRVVLNPAGEQKRYESITDDDGNFEFPVVTAQMNYALRVYGSPSHQDHVEQIRVDRDSYRFDVEVEPYEFGSLSGQLVNLDGVPVPNLELALRNKQSAKPNSFFRTDALGNFRSADIPAGDTVIASRAMPAFSVRGLSIDPDRETRARIVLDWGQHQLAGQVVDRHGHALPASRVMLRWDYESDGITTSATRRTASDAQGHFQFDQLGPGPHRLEVDAPGYESIAFNHDISRDGYNVTIRLN